MKLLDDNLLAEVADNTEASNRLCEEDKDLLESLAKKAAEIESEANNSK
jgi:hypothetical protein